METIHREIAGAFIFSSDGLVLLGQNTPGGANEGEWTIPGGGIEEGESVEQATVREVAEETGVDVTNLHLQACDGEPFTGESLKTIDGQRKLVKMTFHDLHVVLPTAAADTPLGDGDGFYMVRWVSREELPHIPLAKGVKIRLQELGYLE
jgi:8-oxo-dGTP pyrophosphatase MutT (NUDIX family)